MITNESNKISIFNLTTFEDFISQKTYIHKKKKSISSLKALGTWGQKRQYLCVLKEVLIKQTGKYKKLLWPYEKTRIQIWLPMLKLE